MRNIALFVEDYGHEQYINALIHRILDEKNISHTIVPVNVRGGTGRTLSELKEYFKDVKRNKKTRPDLIVVAIDSNCKGLNNKKAMIDKKTPKDLFIPIIKAVPDPHIERWMLLDSHAFLSVFGKGCSAPTTKCDKDRYKTALYNAILDSGVVPLLGGMEYAEKIVAVSDLQRLRSDHSIDSFLKDLQLIAAQWTQ
jgi:hypothetical protein